MPLLHRTERVDSVARMGAHRTIMAISLVSNAASLRAANTMRLAHQDSEQSMRRTSSGSRINAAADDASGSAVAVNLAALMNSTQQAMRNTSDGIAVVQTADASAREVAAIIERGRELAVQAASETLGDDERTYAFSEMKSLALESIRIADSLEFNGKSLGSGTTLQVQVGTEGDSNSRVKFRIMDLRAVGTALKTVNLSSSTNAASSLEVLDEALDTVNSGRASMGAAYNRLESAMANASESMLALTSAKSRIMDTDYAGESATMTANQIKMQASAAALGQANSMSNTVMSLI